MKKYNVWIEYHNSDYLVYSFDKDIFADSSINAQRKALSSLPGDIIQFSSVVKPV